MNNVTAYQLHYIMVAMSSYLSVYVFTRKSSEKASYSLVSGDLRRFLGLSGILYILTLGKMFEQLGVSVVLLSGPAAE